MFVTSYAMIYSLLIILLLTSDTYTSRLVTIVLSRLLLNLRRTALQPTISPWARNNTFSEASHSSESQSDLHFNSHVLGHLGGLLSFEVDDSIEVTTEGPNTVSGQMDLDMVVLEGS